MPNGQQQDTPLNYDRPDDLGHVDDCYQRAHELTGVVIDNARAMSIPIARLPDFLTAVGRVIEAYDAGDADAVMAAMDGVKRVLT